MLEKALQQTAPDLGPDVDVSVTLVDDGQIHELNKEYRGVDRPTDVLSFSLLEEGEEAAPVIVGEQPGPLLLGDLVISLERARAQAEDYGHSYEREVAFLACHGMLHLLGWDHETPDEERVMMAKTEEILGSLGLVRG